MLQAACETVISRLYREMHPEVKAVDASAAAEKILGRISGPKSCMVTWHAKTPRVCAPRGLQRAHFRLATQVLLL